MVVERWILRGATITLCESHCSFYFYATRVATHSSLSSLSYIPRTSKYTMRALFIANNRQVHCYLTRDEERFIYLSVPALHLLPPGHHVLPVGVHEIPDESVEPRLENHTGQRQQRQFAVVPAGHAAHVNVRIASQFAELELLAAGRGDRANSVHGQRGVFVAPGDLHLVPVTVAQVVADGDDLCTASEIVSQPERALHKFHLEEVVSAAVIGVQQQTVALFGLELEL